MHALTSVEAFDYTAEYERDIAPHIKTIYGLCQARRIPALLAVCYKNTAKDDGFSITQHNMSALPGVERTHPCFAIADQALRDDIPMAVKLADSIERMKGDPHFMTEVFDEEAFYDVQLSPLINTIKQKCEQLNIPFLCAMCFAVKQGEGGRDVGFASVHHIPMDKRLVPTYMVALAAMKQKFAEAKAMLAILSLGDMLGDDDAHDLELASTTIH